MLTPEEFRTITIDQAWNLAESIRLATLFTNHYDGNTGGASLASHTPLMLDRSRGDKGTLTGHLARRNLQVSAIAAAETVLVVFLGANAYISPRWYGTHPRVPTWSYIAVHAACRVTMVWDRERMRTMVLDLSRLMEPADTPWKADAVYVDSLVDHVVGFDLEILSIEAQVRLSQQNDLDDRRRVHAALSAGSLEHRRVAQLMEEWSLPPGDSD